MKYTPVFTIEISHEFFSESKPSLFQIVPTKETLGFLQGAGMIAKFVKNKLYVFIKHLDSNTPLLRIPNDLKLQFFLEIVDFDFSKITNYTADDPYNRKLYFSNLESIEDQIDKSFEGVLYLHEKLPLFNVANAYKYNDLVRSGLNNAYECLAKVNANTGNINNTSQFRKLEKVSYVTPSTSLLFTGPEKLIQLQVPANTILIQYFGYNPVSKLYDIEKKSKTIGSEQNPTGINITSALLNFYSENGQLFQEGIYRITLNSQEVFVYLRPQNDWQSYIGIINIHNDALVPANYRYLKEDGTFFMIAPANQEIETRNYIIKFAPAQFLLKYICKTNKVQNIIDESGNIEFNDLGSNIFQSILPVRMNEKAIDTISVQYEGSDLIKKTKNPGYRNLSILDDDNKYLVSETFLNL